MAIDIEYQLQRHGWARFALIDGPRRFEGRSSYMGDPIGELARAALWWATGEGPAYVGFVYEPGTIVCRATCEGDQIRIVSRDYRDGMSNFAKCFESKKDIKSSLFEATESRYVFICKICELLDRRWKQYGCSGYAWKWQGNQFPVGTLLSLRLLTDSAPEADRLRERLRSGGWSGPQEIDLLMAPMRSDATKVGWRALQHLRDCRASVDET